MSAIEIVGWALLHFVWQGALVWLVAAVALRVLRHSAADVRYVVSAVALAVMATLPLATGAQTWLSARETPVAAGAVFEAPRDAGPAPAASQPRAASTLAASAPGRTTRWGSSPRLERWLPGLVLAWMAGVALLALRLIGGWMWMQRMKRGAMPADDALRAAVRRLSKRLHIGRPVALLQAPSINVPTVIGWMKPTVLLPVSALSGLSPLQVEAILAHELAHIRRHDYFVNLLQTLVETLLFYHPAVWWLSRRIRVERENCCDDLAVGLCGDPVVYARALADLEELRGTERQLVMAASGGALIDRVRRLLAGPATHEGRGPAWIAALAAVVLMLGIAGSAVARQPHVSGTSEQVVGRTDIDPLRLAVARTIHYVRNVLWPNRRPQGPPPVPPEPPEPPAPPAAPPDGVSSDTPALPSLPSVPSPPQGNLTVESDDRQSNGNWSWSSNGERLEVKYRGRLELNDTDTDIAKLSPGGYVKVSDGGWLRGRSVEISADAAGTISRRFQVGASERPFEPEGREWLAKVLPRFVRGSGFGAKARVARILRTGGVDGVLAEISLIEGSYGKALYFSELLKATAIDAAAAARIVQQAGHEITSDYELATLLIKGAGTLLVDPTSQKAYLDAARSIDSDYELRRVLAAVMTSGAATPVLAAGVLDVAASLDSDYESATLLLDVVRAQAIDGPLREPFFKVLNGLSSSYEQGRVLQAMVRRGELPAATLLDVLNAAGRMSSHHESSQVLQAAARTQTIAGPARDAYVGAADRLGDHDQEQALAALVRHERR